MATPNQTKTTTAVADDLFGLSGDTPCKDLPDRAGVSTLAPPPVHGRHVAVDAFCDPEPPAWDPAASRTVLIIASRFPPVASVGAIRVRKLAKYLCDFGWKPVVITGAMRRGQSHSQDARRATDEESLLDLPEGLPVHRVSRVLDHWPTLLSRWGAVRLARITNSLGLAEADWRGKLDWRLRRLHDRLAFPDRGVWRLPSVVRLAMRLHKQYRFDAIFSTGMPFSDHLIGLTLRSMMRRPWLADFRDPWVEYIHWLQWKGPWGRRMTRLAEAAVVRRASRVISVNDAMTSRFAARYARQPAGKFVTIPNGFDPADFTACDDTRQSLYFRLVHAGSLYNTRAPDAMLEAFGRFLRSVPGSRRHARFEFLGRPGPHIDKLTNGEAGGAIRYLGMLPHSAATRAMARADLNVVILPNLPGGANDTTAKIYECLGSGRPILAAVPLDGAAAKLLRRFDGVSLCDPDDVEAIAAAIAEWYRRWIDGRAEVHRRAEDLAPLTRRYQARQLASSLDEAVCANRSTARLAQ